MDNKDVLVLNKISDHINAVISYCELCFSLDDFQADPMNVEACVFNLCKSVSLQKSHYPIVQKLRSQRFRGNSFTACATG